MDLVHHLSKDARIEILKILLESRNRSGLASELGLTPASITKYLERGTHPRDSVINRCLSIADDKERRKIASVIFHDIAKALLELLKSEYGREISSDEKTDMLAKIAIASTISEPFDYVTQNFYTT